MFRSMLFSNKSILQQFRSCQAKFLNNERKATLVPVPFFTYNLLNTLAIAQSYLLTFTCLFDPFWLCCCAPASNNSNNNATHQASPILSLKARTTDPSEPLGQGGSGGQSMPSILLLEPWISDLPTALEHRIQKANVRSKFSKCRYISSHQGAQQSFLLHCM